MDVVVVDNYEEMSRGAADIVVALARQEPEALVILPAGETPKGLYRLLAAAQRAGTADFSRLTVMALDEWGGRSPDNPLSCRQLIATAFVDQVRIPPERFHALDGTALDPEAACRRYGALLTKLGRPSLAVLGLGTNGHIGLNEPAASLPIGTHVVPLAGTTLARAATELGGQAASPYGLTLGMDQIMSAEKILLLASGRHKQTAVRAMLAGPIRTTLPASLLHLHPNVVVILDETAAGRSGAGADQARIN
jgi:glucosamine-6-phosphate isomerase